MGAAALERKILGCILDMAFDLVVLGVAFGDECHFFFAHAFVSSDEAHGLGQLRVESDFSVRDIYFDCEHVPVDDVRDEGLSPELQIAAVAFSAFAVEGFVDAAEGIAFHFQLERLERAITRFRALQSELRHGEPGGVEAPDAAGVVAAGVVSSLSPRSTAQPDLAREVVGFKPVENRVGRRIRKRSESQRKSGIGGLNEIELFFFDVGHPVGREC